MRIDFWMHISILVFPFFFVMLIALRWLIAIESNFGSWSVESAQFFWLHQKLNKDD